MLKLIGALLIICGTTVFGIMRGGIVHRRYKNLIKIDAGLTVMENEILYSKDYIDEIFKKIAANINIDEIFLHAVNLSHNTTVAERWRQAVYTDAKKLCLSQGDCEVIAMLSSELGLTDSDGQIKNINHVRSLLKAQISDAHDEYIKQSGLMRGMGVTVGIFIVILLL